MRTISINIFHHHSIAMLKKQTVHVYMNATQSALLQLFSEACQISTSARIVFYGSACINARVWDWDCWEYHTCLCNAQ